MAIVQTNLFLCTVFRRFSPIFLSWSVQWVLCDQDKRKWSKMAPINGKFSTWECTYLGFFSISHSGQEVFGHFPTIPHKTLDQSQAQASIAPGNEDGIHWFGGVGQFVAQLIWDILWPWWAASRELSHASAPLSRSYRTWTITTVDGAQRTLAENARFVTNQWKTGQKTGYIFLLRMNGKNECRVNFQLSATWGAAVVCLRWRSWEIFPQNSFNRFSKISPPVANVR